MREKKGMSIQTKTTILMVCAVLAATLVAIVISVSFIGRIGSESAKQTLLLLCRTGEKNLDYYFGSVEQSVEMVSSFVTEDLEATDLAQLDEHIERARTIFGQTVKKTGGVLTYYYRIDPTVSATVKGFWYTNLDGYISDLNSLAYGDALTSVRNKGAFNIHVREIQARVDDPNDTPEFAVGIFDCDNLKMINDTYGHDKGDMYLQNSSHLICRVFRYSPVFRLGGDEFAVILQNEDYRNRKLPAKFFRDKSAEICAFATGPWEEIRVAMGIATYDPSIDHSVEDVIHRADRLMYEDKRMRKGN